MRSSIQVIPKQTEGIASYFNHMGPIRTGVKLF